jgi:hypothetical protein
MSNALADTRTGELVPVTGGVLAPVASTHDLVASFRAYQDAVNQLLTDDDYQPIGGKKFRKRSGWRKLATAMGVDLELRARDYERDDAGRITRAEVVARAKAPNGRYADGLGACDVFERCCTRGCDKRHRHCPAASGTACPGFSHFSKPQHDIPATAHTRSVNRACADLFGAGEVSAEEMEGVEEAGRAPGADTQGARPAASRGRAGRGSPPAPASVGDIRSVEQARAYAAAQPGDWLERFNAFRHEEGAEDLREAGLGRILGLMRRTEASLAEEDRDFATAEAGDETTQASNDQGPPGDVHHAQQEGSAQRRRAEASGAGEREPASHAESADGEVAGDVRDNPAPDSVPPQPGADDFPRAGGAATARVRDLADEYHVHIATALKLLSALPGGPVTSATVLSGDALAAARKALASGGDGS